MNAIASPLKTIYYQYKSGLESPKEIVVHRINKLLYGQKRATEIKHKKEYEALKRVWLKGDVWDFNGIKLPYDEGIAMEFLGCFKDSLYVFCYFNDNYDRSIVDLNFSYEGTYGYKMSDPPFEVMVKKGDVVIDAGAWIGDFSAYASIKGATCYAFEPNRRILPLLRTTRQLNPNIHVVEKGLGNQSGFSFFEQSTFHSGGGKVTSEPASAAERVEITTIDDFVATQKLERVDFIKADIEGFERYMLQGAVKTLREFAPELAICTYHLPDDPQVLAKIVLEANPNYRIVQKRCKLYASAVKR